MRVLVECLAVGAGGSVGALARLAVNRASARLFPVDFPVGTLLINVSGSFALGWFLAWAAGRAGVSDAARAAVAVGFLGAYTTFSTFAHETDRLADQGATGRAVLNVVASIVLGLIAVRLGAIAGRVGG